MKIEKLQNCNGVNKSLTIKLLTLFALVMFAFGCKKNVAQPLATEFMLTIRGDEKLVTKELQSLKLRRGVDWKSIKHLVESTAQAAGDNYIIKEWRLDGPTGAKVEDSFQFVRDTTVYAVSAIPETSVKITVKLGEGLESTDLDFAKKNQYKEANESVLSRSKGTTWSMVQGAVDRLCIVKKEFGSRLYKLGGEKGPYLVNADNFKFQKDTVIYVFALDSKKENAIITVEVKKDAGFTELNSSSAPSTTSFNVDKDAKWQDVKDLAVFFAKIKDDGEIKEWKFDNDKGRALSDDTSLSESCTVYAVAKPREEATYTVRHMLESVSSQGSYDVVADMETLKGKVKAKTAAKAKKYTGFEFTLTDKELEQAQKEIGADGKTTIQLNYKRKRAKIALELGGGTMKQMYGSATETAPTEIAYGQDLAMWKYGKGKKSNSEYKLVRDDNAEFMGWKPELPATPTLNDKGEIAENGTIYRAVWKVDRYKVNINDNDIRITMPGRTYVSVSAKEATKKKLKDVKQEIEKSLRIYGYRLTDDIDYEIYQWRFNGRDGKVLADADWELEIDSDITLYPVSNLKKTYFKKEGGKLTNFEKTVGNTTTTIEARGEIILPSDITSVDSTSTATSGSTPTPNSNKLTSAMQYVTGLDVSEATGLITLKCPKESSGSSLAQVIGLDKCTKLTTLDLQSNSSLNSLDISACTELTELNLSGCQMYGEFKGLEKCTKLTKLNLKNTNRRELDLSEHKALTELNLGNNNSLKLTGLANCTALTYLNLSSTNWSGFFEIDALTALKKLDMSSNNNLQFVDLSKYVNLEELHLNNTGVTGVQASACTKLAKVNLGSCDGLQIVDLSNTKIKNVGGNFISTQEGCCCVARCKELIFKGCTELADVKMTGSGYGSTNVNILDLRGCSKYTQVTSTDFNGGTINTLYLPALSQNVPMSALNSVQKVIVPNADTKTKVTASGYADSKVEVK